MTNAKINPNFATSSHCNLITISKGLVYDMYGIFVDYLIDKNLYLLLDNPKYNYENIKNFNKWYVAEIKIDGKAFLIADIDLGKFSYCNYYGCYKRVLKLGMNSFEAIEELKAYSEILGIELLNMMEFYINGNKLAIPDNKYFEII